MRHNANLKKEKELWKRGYKVVAGLDEVGRGCLAGPVMAGAVVVIPDKIKNQRFYSALFSKKPKHGRKTKNILKEIKDSKQLSPKKREEFYEILTNHSQIKWAVGRVSEKIIDKINILEATKLAMNRAVANLEKKIQKNGLNGRMIDFLIIDGRIKLSLGIPQKSIIKADEKIFSCAAGSIIAKVLRDREMRRMGRKYFQYGFSEHKGYGTKFHFKMLKKYGPSVIHRRTFKPVKNYYMPSPGKMGISIPKRI